jgi:hypothetical protein
MLELTADITKYKFMSLCEGEERFMQGVGVET